MSYRNPPFDCQGAQIWAVCRQLATVVTVTGDIDESNADCVSQCIRRFVLAEKPFVLDLSGVNSFATQSISLLFKVDDVCGSAGVAWSLVASQPVTRVLRTSGPDLPTAASVPEALHHFADDIAARRRLLPLLSKTA